MRLAFAPYNLIFKEPGGTSRGVMTTKSTYFIKIWDEANPQKFGIGEAAIFRGLSAEDNNSYELKLIKTLSNVALGIPTDLSHYSSIKFGLEQAIYDYSNGARGIYFPSEFVNGNKSITINGLIWMGEYDEMIRRIDEKIKSGFHCLKLKIGAIDFLKEIEMIKYIRSYYSASTLEIRVDANGGFNMDNIINALNILAKYDIHSIEQPIKQGQWELMKFLCQISPLPIALDEELIGISSIDKKKALLETIRPEYIILKPALCGGFSGAEEWIKLANERDIKWWVTSALESNIGLNAIAQWVATLKTDMPQGLGTGGVFKNNFHTPIFLDNEKLKYDNRIVIDYSQFENLEWRM